MRYFGRLSGSGRNYLGKLGYNREDDERVSRTIGGGGEGNGATSEGGSSGEYDEIDEMLSFGNAGFENGVDKLFKVAGVFLIAFAVFFFSGGRYVGYSVVNNVVGISYGSLFGIILLVGGILILFFRK